MNVRVGVPQGSVLGPQLFNLFINDLTAVAPGRNILFADDGVFYVTDRCIDRCFDKAQILLNNLAEWMNENKLVINSEKTKVMMFSNCSFNDLRNLIVNGVTLEWVSTIRYLGILIDNKMNFVPHSQQVLSKLSRLHGIFYCMKNVLPKRTLISLYNSLVYPAITENIIIWGGIYKSNLINIKIMINKILRCICRVNFDENFLPLVPTNEMFKSLNFLKFDDVHKLFLLKFIHFCFYKDNTFFDEYFAPLLPNHSYLTRNKRINLPSCRLDIQKHSTIFQCCKLLNEVSEELINPQSNRSLNKQFKIKCLTNY